MLIIDTFTQYFEHFSMKKTYNNIFLHMLQLLIYVDKQFGIFLALDFGWTFRRWYEQTSYKVAIIITTVCIFLDFRIKF